MPAIITPTACTSCRCTPLGHAINWPWNCSVSCRTNPRLRLLLLLRTASTNADSAKWTALISRVYCSTLDPCAIARWSSWPRCNADPNRKRHRFRSNYATSLQSFQWQPMQLPQQQPIRTTMKMKTLCHWPQPPLTMEQVNEHFNTSPYLSSSSHDDLSLLARPGPSVGRSVKIVITITHARGAKPLARFSARFHSISIAPNERKAVAKKKTTSGSFSISSLLPPFRLLLLLACHRHRFGFPLLTSASAAAAAPDSINYCWLTGSSFHRFHSTANNTKSIAAGKRRS